MSAATGQDTWRSPATASPFGLLADLGAAVAAELGMTPRQIAQQLARIDGGLVGDEVARAAVVRGRREMAARRLDPRRFRAGAPAPAAPDAPADADGIEQLLAWGERTAGYPQTAALRARAYLRELAAWHQVAEPSKAPKARRPHRRGNPYTERGARVAYDSLVLAWAASQHLPIPANGRVSPQLAAAYERAHADPAADGAPAAALDQALAAKEKADREAIKRAVAAVAGAPPSGPG